MLWRQQKYRSVFTCIFFHTFPVRFIKLTLGMFTIRKSFSNRTARIEIQYGFGEVLDLARSNIEIGCTGFWSVVNEYIFLFFFFFSSCLQNNIARPVDSFERRVIYTCVCLFWIFRPRSDVKLFNTCAACTARKRFELRQHYYTRSRGHEKSGTIWF